MEEKKRTVGILSQDKENMAYKDGGHEDGDYENKSDAYFNHDDDSDSDDDDDDDDDDDEDDENDRIKLIPVFQALIKGQIYGSRKSQ